MSLDSTLLVIFADKHVGKKKKKKKKKLYAKMEKLEAQIWRCTREGLKVIP